MAYDITVDRNNTQDILVNELVYALTNRQGSFVDNLLPNTNKAFRPEDQGILWNSLRAGLFLDNELTDYFIVLAVSILNAHPDVFSMLSNRVISFEPTDILKYRSSIDGGSFFTSGNILGEILPYSDYYPLAFEYVIKYKTATTVDVFTDIQRNFVLDCKIFKKGAGSAIAINWHERLPFKGPIKSDVTWREGSRIVIKYIPTVIRYDKWVQYIEAKLVVENVLTPVGLYTVYQLSRSPTEKIALLLVALALQNNSTDNGQQTRHRST